MTIAEALAEATQMLAGAGNEESAGNAGSARSAGSSTTARRDVQILLGWATNRNRTYLVVHNNDELSTEIGERFRSAVRRRAAGEPVQYITKRQEFFGLEFEVTPAVLIPRPETELIVEASLELLPSGEALSFCDVGAGSGCISVALLHHLPRVQAVMLDISLDALEVARRNALRHKVAAQSQFVHADVFDSFGESAEPFLVSPFALIVSNPPYIPADELPTLAREVRDFEPSCALTPGGDGLDIVRRLLRDAHARLLPGGYLIFEIGYGQAPRVRQLIDENLWRILRVCADLQGIPRTFVLQRG